MRQIGAVVMVAAALCASSACAQNAAVVPKGALPPVAQLLAAGYDVKTGFIAADNTAYLVLQKATSAYLCRTAPTPTCDKLN